MELSIAGIIAAVGVLFGLNFVGLFIATYVFDRKATHVLYYLAAAAAFMANGIAYLLSILTPYPALFLVFVEMFQALGFVVLSLGLDRAFSLGASRRFLWSLFAVGSIFAISLSQRNEIDVTRLTAVSLWHVIAVAYLVALLVRAPQSGFKHRFLAVLLSGTAFAAANRVITAVYVQAFHPTMSFAWQVETYGAIVNTFYMTTLFGVGAGLVFHVMSDLASDYRSASITDGLTGLLNRRGFIDSASEAGFRPSVLIMLDIDHFKSINDTHGHDAGDRVIAAVAAIMRRVAPQPHLCGRLGGEEFAILLRRTEMATAHALAQSLRTAIAIELEGFVAENHSVTASLGVALVRDGVNGVATALTAADHALYAAKRDGRNLVRLEGTERRNGGRAVTHGIGASGALRA